MWLVSSILPPFQPPGLSSISTLLASLANKTVKPPECATEKPASRIASANLFTEKKSNGEYRANAVGGQGELSSDRAVAKFSQLGK